MQTLSFPQHASTCLLTHGSAIDLSPMEPQPTRMDEHVAMIQWGESWASYDKRQSPEEMEIIDEWMLPWKPGDVVMVVADTTERPGIRWTQPAWHARCESVTPIRLAEISEEQARETGENHSYFSGSYGGVREWWTETHPQYPWQTSWAWMRRWVLEKGA